MLLGGEFKFIVMEFMIMIFYLITKLSILVTYGSGLVRGLFISATSVYGFAHLPE